MLLILACLSKQHFVFTNETQCLRSKNVLMALKGSKNLFIGEKNKRINIYNKNLISLF
jgi:hypothetical protein